ncbi:MAG: EF-hand domain-containing protein [Methylobacterium sp.]|uniref:EF-hand domain-containing protein n=1 Tax=Methylobacterium sp. TaxID=409 RepID=UPI0025D2FBF9|nr:EF-hand domain-containing protein [Methylobacterium sp.]MBX9930982.1 EF-hand domain-containing protein [Methylobacterium sp.]
MPPRLTPVFLASLFALGVAAPAFAAPSAQRALEMLDPDKDGTVDLKEALAGASARFDALDPDKDSTLDKRELKGRVKASELKAADPDNDGTLDKKEYLAIVEQRFKAADPDNDGTLDKKELGTPAGKALLRLIR